MNLTTSPDIGRKTFQWFVSVAPFVTVVLVSIQSQARAREFDAWVLLDVGIGALVSLIVAQANNARAGTETAERNAEVVTGTNQDADPEVEQPEGATP